MSWEPEPKKIVEQAYDNIAPWYLEWAQSQKSPREEYTERLFAGISATKPKILELGCGAGVPIVRLLLDRGAEVVGNDVSTAQIKMARERCPEAEFIAGDMLALDFPPSSFDGVISFYAIFHLPREQQRDMLRKISSWLRPDGMFVLNLATMDEEEIHGEFLGHGMFWSSFDVEANKTMIRESGLDIISADVREAGDGKLAEDDPDYGVSFLWIVTKKAVAEQGSS